MEGQRAEGTGTETAPVADQTELNLFNGGDAAGLLIAGMVGAAVGEGVDIVHFLGGQGLLGRVLNHIQVTEGLGKPFGGEGIAVAILNFEGLGIFPLVLLQLLIAGKYDGGQALVQFLHAEHGAVDVGDVPDIHAGIQSVGHLHDAPLAHAIEQQVRLRIQQDGPLHGLGPVVVVGKSAQAGFDTADDDGDFLIGLTDQIAVHNSGVVGSLAHHTAGSVGIGFAPVLGDGIVVHHGVHIAAGDQETQSGAAIDIDGGRLFPVRLGDDAHLVARLFQHTADDGVAEGVVIHIRVTDYIDKIALIPAPVNHILFAKGEKFHNVPP